MNSNENSGKPEGKLPLAPAPLLGIIFQGVSFPDFCRLLVLLVKPLAYLPLIVLLKFRYAIFEVRVKLLKCLFNIRKALLLTRIICLKRRYLFPEKGDLISDSWFARAGVYHPVEVVKVFFECFHRCRDGWRVPMMPDDKSSATGLGDNDQSHGTKPL